MGTKERILLESLKLFSIYGFQGVSIREIADKVGIGNSALYKHYKSKQGILDAIIQQAKEQFYDKSKNSIDTIKENNDLQKICLEMYKFQTEDEWMVMIRRLLIIEQFRSDEMADMYKTFFIDGPIQIMIKIFTELIEKGYMKSGNPEVMAMELYAPFFMYHTVTKDNLRELFKEHINKFMELYFN